MFPKLSSNNNTVNRGMSSLSKERRNWLSTPVQGRACKRITKSEGKNRIIETFKLRRAFNYKDRDCHGPRHGLFRILLSSSTEYQVPLFQEKKDRTREIAKLYDDIRVR